MNSIKMDGNFFFTILKDFFWGMKYLFLFLFFNSNNNKNNRFLSRFFLFIYRHIDDFSLIDNENLNSK